jgi:hypothetical protein
VKASLSNENGGVVANTHAVFATLTGDIHARAEIVLVPKLKTVSAGETLLSKRNQRDKTKRDKTKRDKDKQDESELAEDRNWTENHRTETADL